MDDRRKIADWASSQIGFDKEETSVIFSKLRLGCGEEIWSHVVKHARNVRQKNMVAAASVLCGHSQQQSKNDSADFLHQKKYNIKAEILHLEKDVDDIIHRVAEKEDKVEGLQRCCNCLRHKAFLLDRNLHLNETTSERYSELKCNAKLHYDAITHRRKSAGASQLSMLGESSPVRETRVYRNIEQTIDLHAKQLLKQLEDPEQEGEEAKKRRNDDLEAEVENMRMNFSVGDILQCMKLHAKSNADSVKNLEDKMETGNEQHKLRISENKVASARKEFDQSFQDVRDEYIRNFFEIQKRRRSIKECAERTRTALADYDRILEMDFAGDRDALELSRSLIRLEMKHCFQKGKISALKEMIELEESLRKVKKSRGLIVMTRKIAESEKALFRKYSFVLEMLSANAELTKTIHSQREQVNNLLVCIRSKCDRELKPLLRSLCGSLDAEIDLFADLEMKNLTVNTVGDKQVQVFDMTIHNRKKTGDMECLMTAAHIQSFHAPETLLRNIYLFALGMKENDALEQPLSILRKQLTESTQKIEEHNQSYKELLQKTKWHQQSNLIPFLAEQVSLANAAISECKKAEENISVCNSWDQTSAQSMT